MKRRSYSKRRYLTKRRRYGRIKRRTYRKSRRMVRGRRRGFNRRGNMFTRGRKSDYPCHARFIHVDKEVGTSGTTGYWGYPQVKTTFNTIVALSDIAPSIQAYTNMYRYYKVHHITLVIEPSADNHPTNDDSKNIISTSPEMIVLNNHYGGETAMDTIGEFRQQRDAKSVKFIGGKRFAITGKCKAPQVTITESTDQSTAWYPTKWSPLGYGDSILDPGFRVIIDFANGPNYAFKLYWKYYISFKGLKLYS